MDVDRTDLMEAIKQVTSIISKCEKALLNQRVGSPQHTLLTRRIRAMQISKDLMQERLSMMEDANETSKNIGQS